MYRRAGLLGQHSVPHNHQLLRDGGAAMDAQSTGDLALVDGVVLHQVPVLAVGEDGQALPGGLHQAVAHHVGVLHRHSVVGQGRHPRLTQRGGVGKLFPVLVDGQRADG